MRYKLVIAFDRDATLGRGDGVAGLIDSEVEHDPRTGLPFLRGRTLKGLLVEECANILYSLELQKSPQLPVLEAAAQFSFGRAGSTLEDEGHLWVGPAQMPEELIQAVELEIENNKIIPAMVLETLTAIRRQTAVDAGSGAPEEHSLRAARVLLRDTTLESELNFRDRPEPEVLALLAACVLGLRRGGGVRNRGRGRFSARLLEEGNDCIRTYISSFETLLQGGQP